MKLLIIEDERELSDSIACYLGREDYLCEQAFTFDEAVVKIGVFEYDCILLDLLLQEGLNEQQLSLVQDIYSAGNRMARLNRNLLLLAKIDNNQYSTDELVDVNRLIDEDIEICKNIYNRLNITFSKGNNCNILAKSTLTEVMINNLLVNAMRNTAPEGRIEILHRNFTHF